jgi:hypothetical protein
MSIVHFPSRALWYADGLRWLGSLCHLAADHLVESSRPVDADPLRSAHRPVHEYLFDVRHRIHLRY